MRILAVDVGTGTQDVLLFDTALDLENGYKLVLPSPTMIVHRRLKQATERREAVALTGTLMGGGPSQWAARDHVRAGGTLYATPEAARTFNDDLDYVQREMGVRLLDEAEVRRLPEVVVRLTLRDFDYPRLAAAFAAFGVELEAEAVAVAVFDHGDAPPGYSDRQFRFDYLDAQVRQAPGLMAFAHRAEAVPPSMTRLAAVARSAREQGVAGPLMVMDTAPAAVLGASLDPVVGAGLRAGALVANVGNFHCLAFRLRPEGTVAGLFEHHTGEVTRAKLDGLLEALAASTLRHADVFEDMGHGALVYDTAPMAAPAFVAVTGPRRNLMRGSRHQPYFAVPYGDMMIAGCFGLVAALPGAFPEFTEPVRRSLENAGGVPPWEAG